MSVGQRLTLMHFSRHIMHNPMDFADHKISMVFREQHILFQNESKKGYVAYKKQLCDT